jgi:hypothetical protein
MDDSNTIKFFTATDIEKYHKGLLSAKEMHDLEKAALDDPFLADAMEGYSSAEVNAAGDIAELKQRLVERTEDAKVIVMKGTGGQRKFAWLRAAAIVLVVGGAGIIAQKMFTVNKQKGLAKNEAAEVKTVTPSATSTDTSVSVTTDGLVSTETNTSTTYFTRTDSNKEGSTIANGKAKVNSSTAVNNGPVSTTGNSDGLVKETEVVRSDAKNTQPVIISPGNAEGNVTVRKNVTDSVNYWAKDVAKEDAYRKAKKALSDKDRDGINDQFDREETKQTAPSVAVNNNNQNRKGALNNQPVNIFRGRVTDENNVGLPFARVMNPADNNAGTYTDVRGYFTLTHPDTTVQVQVRSVGFDNNNIQLRSSVVSNQVTMQDDRSLAEVVISTKKPNTDRHRDANMKLVEPEPVDGWDNYDTYIANNLEMPDEFKTKPAYGNGTVEVSFEVNKYGEPINIKVEKSLCSKCDKEAIRLVKEGPKWRRNANKKGRTTVTVSF